MKNAVIYLIFFFTSGFTAYSQETGFITGSLTDQYTGEPLFGVKVKAWEQGGLKAWRRGGVEAGKSLEFVTMSDEDGHFNLDLPAGTYNIEMKRYGLGELMMGGIIMPSNDTVILDTALTPVAVPIAGVNATLEWEYAIVEGTPSGPSLYEKSIDNGELSDLFTFQEAGSQVAVKFDNSDNHIIGGRIFVGDGSFPGPFLGTDVLIRVYDDEGMEGLPGNVLYEDTVTVDQYGWVGFDGLDALALTEHYYLAMVQLNDAPDCVPVGCAQYPANSSSLMKIGSYNWEPFPLGNAMIRAWVAAPHDSLHVTNYRISRYSGFDPSEGNPQSGELTELASSSYPYYTDNTIGFYPAICFAYGIKALYNNGMYSPYRVSNIIYKTPPFNVSLAVGQSDSSTMGITRIMFTGQDWPFKNYSSFFQSPGTVSFPSVSRSKYQVSVYKPGYDKMVLDSVEILSDTLIECLLNEKLYPLKNLQVNAYSGILTWKPENISLFDWQCSVDSICHDVTTTELDLTCANQWIMSVVYRYPTDYDPAYVDYSTDQGRTWATLYQFNTTDDWDTVQLDLSEFSGYLGETAIMLQVHDLHGAPYYLDISQVRVWSPDLKVHPDKYYITLNNEPAGISDSTYYKLNGLVHGQHYLAGVNAVYSTGMTDTIFTEFTYFELFPPRNQDVYMDGDSIRYSWSPPSGTWNIDKHADEFPDALVGYVMRYVTADDTLRFDFNSPWDTTFSMARPDCDTANITITALYDLSNYGYPGMLAESDHNDLIEIIPGLPIYGEFYEDWSTMSFYHNCWNDVGYGIALIADQGNPGPALVFQNPDNHYQAYLTSIPISIPQSDDAILFLEFDLNLTCSGQSGYEILDYQVLPDGSTDWQLVQGFSNALGNINWQNFKIDLSGFIETDLFQFRMKFEGIGSEPVQWKVDNIHVHSVCYGPPTLQAEMTGENEVNLNWNSHSNTRSVTAFDHYNIFRKFNDNDFLLLATTTDTFYTDYPDSGGRYCYQVNAAYNDNGIICESSLSDSAWTISTYTISEKNVDDCISIYPNPVNERLFMRSDEKMLGYILFNSLGYEVSKDCTSGFNYAVEMKDKYPGIYFLQIELIDRTIFRKIVH
jgi:hypothetical protein